MRNQSLEPDMECPKCDGEFKKITFSGIEIERCNTCQGLWFGLLEKEDLVKIEGSESIDIGSEQVGESYSTMRDIECPHCGDLMIVMIDKDQFHIEYESCPSCFGTFFDAGEFKDLKEHSVVERFMQMLETLRSNL
jgi:Zn-finger nucleic acid-binding protein